MEANAGRSSPKQPDIIDLDSDTPEDDQFQGWTPPPCVDAHDSMDRKTTPSPDPYQTCLKAILRLFPDISHDHVRKIWGKRLPLDAQAHGQVDIVHQRLIETILDGGAYPKERDRLKELKKRKRDSPEVEAARWKFLPLRPDAEEYARVAKTHLSERFAWVPSRFIADIFKEHNHYYGAFFAIEQAERKADGSVGAPFARLKSIRKAQGVGSAQLIRSLEASGHDFEGLKDEMNAAGLRWVKEDEKRRLAAEALEAQKIKEEEYRQKGELIECACCFDDIPPTSMTHCNADVPHFFCFDCARRNAANDMTSLKYALRCMDQSRCEATFGREQRTQFLDIATIDKLERLQQQDEIRRADMGGLETCPFCDYAAICPPVNVDKVFECANPECMEVSCRLCREKNHIPMSCEESKRENGIGERHAVEEARTMALIRSCKKCKVQILKEDGCNKVVCTNCYSVICDFCGEDITKIKYQHFDGDGRVGFASDKGKCPLYDTSNKRKEDQIEQAGRLAMEKIREDNPNISEEDLRIRFAKAVEDTTKRRDVANPMDPMAYLAGGYPEALEIPPYVGHRRNAHPPPLDAAQQIVQYEQQQHQMRQRLLEMQLVQQRQMDAMREDQRRRLQRLRDLNPNSELLDLEERGPRALQDHANGDDMRTQFVPGNIYQTATLALPPQDAATNAAWQPPGQMIYFNNLAPNQPPLPPQIPGPPPVFGGADGDDVPGERGRRLQALHRQMEAMRQQTTRQQAAREQQAQQRNEHKVEAMQREARENIAARRVHRRNEEAKLDDHMNGIYHPRFRTSSPPSQGEGLDAVDRHMVAELAEKRRHMMERHRRTEPMKLEPQDRRPDRSVASPLVFGNARETPFVLDEDPYSEMRDVRVAGGRRRGECRREEREDRRREEREGDQRRREEVYAEHQDEAHQLNEPMSGPRARARGEAASPTLPLLPRHLRPDPVARHVFGSAPGDPINLDNPFPPRNNPFRHNDFAIDDMDFEHFIGPIIDARGHADGFQGWSPEAGYLE